MRKLGFIIISLFVFMSCGLAQAALLDVVQSPTGFFCPDESLTYSSPYYRWWDEDWSWQHNAIGGTITSAVLDISAWDVDAPSEIDNIYAYDGANRILLGSLAGGDGIWGYSTFTLGSQFYDDIGTGLRVDIDIDTTHSYDHWAVTLAKSALSLNGNTYLPDPTPGAPVEGAGVPEPASMILMGIGLAGAAWRKRKRA